MHDFEFVHVLDRLQDVLDECARFIFGVVALFCDTIHELAAVHDLHHDVVVEPVRREVEEAHDVRMIQLLHDPDFTSYSVHIRPR